MSLQHSILLAALLCVPILALQRSYDRGPVALSDKASLHWTLNNETKRISLALTVTDAAVLSGTGVIWVALGISEETSGSMPGADIMSAEFGPDMLSNCTIADRYVPFAAYPIGETTANASSVFPLKDFCQSDGSWQRVACTRDANGTATLEVERALKAHDEQDRDIGPGSQAILHAYGSRVFQYHGNNRASTRVVLFNEDGSYPSGEELAIPKDVSFTHTVLATNYTVPSANVTTYSCTTSVVPLPKSGRRVLVAADPIIQSVSGKNKAHHLIVYACADTPYSKRFLKTDNCMDEGPAGSRGNCTAFLYGWAVGAGRFLMPEGVGLELDETNNVLIMETHYDNSDRATDAVDASGAKLYFAEDRPVQAGMLSLGDPGLSLFGRTVKHDFNYQSSCPSNCTATWKQEINVFFSFLHMHTTGRKMYTNKYDKDGNFVEALHTIDYWSNDHQIGKEFKTPKKIRPGDKLSTSCIYDTRKRPGTKFGLATKDEMCIDFVVYYPLQKRFSSDGAMFQCSLSQLEGDNSGTICGTAIDRRSFSFQRNPTFNATAGTNDTFGDQPRVCSVAAKAPGATATGAPGKGTGLATPSGNSTSRADCFPGAAVVRTRRGEVRMRDLQVGDEVHVGAGRYSHIFLFTHRVPVGQYAFVEVRTKTRAVTLSEGHYLYANGKLVPAKAVRVGDAVCLEDNGVERVERVRRTVAEGLYNPQTLHGDIAVDGVRASTYTDAVPPKAAHALLAPLRAGMRAAGVSIDLFEKDEYAAVRRFRSVRSTATA